MEGTTGSGTSCRMDHFLMELFTHVMRHSKHEVICSLSLWSTYFRREPRVHFCSSGCSRYGPWELLSEASAPNSWRSRFQSMALICSYLVCLAGRFTIFLKNLMRFMTFMPDDGKASPISSICYAITAQLTGRGVAFLHENIQHGHGAFCASLARFQPCAVLILTRFFRELRRPWRPAKRALFTFCLLAKSLP